MPRDRSGGLDGILVVAKPAGMTSHDVVALVRRLSATRRVGHGGTLDPFATGVLTLFLGRTTRLVEYHMADEKAYRATVCFGASSTTDDLEGELTPVAGPPPTRDAVEAALPGFLGGLEQRPPDYSAIQVEGRRAYAMARAGQRPRLAPRRVEIRSLELVDWDGSDPERPVAVVDVVCSAGTYVRALARDIGVAVGSAAYLGALTRMRSGRWTMDDALPLERLREAAAGGPSGIGELLRPVDTGLEWMPAVRLEPDEVADLVRGRFVRPRHPGSGPTEGPVRLVDADERLVAVGAWSGGRVSPRKVLVGLTDVPATGPTDVPAPGPAAVPGAGDG